MKKHLALKIIASLLPAIIFTQNYAWMNQNKAFGFTFLILWASFVLLFLNYESKNKLLWEIFRTSEIGMFLLPLSAIILTFVFGSKVAENASGAAGVGAMIGVALGGFMVIILAAIIGLFGGVIFHLIANRYEKKIKPEEQTAIDNLKPNFFQKHPALTIIILILVFAVINGITQNKSNIIASSNNQNTNGTVANTNADKDEPSNTNQPADSCPNIVKSPSAFSFAWSKTTEGNDGLFLAPDFIKQMEFGNDFKLDNLPDVSGFASDDFNCEKGSSAGESINKLYCRPTFMYKPLLKKKNIDKDGNIVNTEDRYIKSFIFDITDKDYKVVNDLKSLKLESITCSNEYF